MNTFLPPAGLRDFDARPALYQTWHTTMAELFSGVKFTDAGQDIRPAFYSPLTPPSRANPATATPTWNGYPKILTELYPGNVLTGSAGIDEPTTFGTRDGERVTFRPFLDAHGKPLPTQQYRAQDEYLEWAVQRDSGGKALEILLTCEGPEYWSTIASDPNFLQQMYQAIVGIPVPQADLFFNQTCTWVDLNSSDANGNPVNRPFAVGDYNPYNSWNLKFAVHLTHPANQLGAEVNLAAAASLRFTRQKAPVLTNPALTCCQGIGEPNRSSDPNIAAQVNSLAMASNFVTLRNPVGLYLLSIDGSRFQYPDGKPIIDITRYFQPLRQSSDGSMIVRAALRVPAGETYNGRPLLLSQLQLDHQPIQFGGQVAAAITMGLFAQALPGAPAQSATECALKPCPDPNFPSVIIPTDVNTPCRAPHTAALVDALADTAPGARASLTMKGRTRVRIR
jgi:hypothetical protein